MGYQRDSVDERRRRRDEERRRRDELEVELDTMDEADFEADRERLAVLIFKTATATPEERLRYRAGTRRAVNAMLAADYARGLGYGRGLNGD
jgi:hypothetical protein